MSCTLSSRRSAWVRRLQKPILEVLDHRTKRVTPLRLARSVDFVLFLDDARQQVVLIEHLDHALYIGQQLGGEPFASVVVTPKVTANWMRSACDSWSCASAAGALSQSAMMAVVIRFIIRRT
jgi:hypothetical protein